MHVTPANDNRNYMYPGRGWAILRHLETVDVVLMIAMPRLHFVAGDPRCSPHQRHREVVGLE